MAQRQLPSDVSLLAFLPSRWHLACRQPLMLFIFLAALVQLVPMGIQRAAEPGSNIAAGVTNVSADAKVAIEIVRPAGQSGHVHEHRPESQKTLDLGFALVSQAKYSSPQWHCCSCITELDTVAAANLVDLHVRLQI
ncbi:hypothetical protein [Novipirellula caenicola]|uniref:Uncharacterized protein n=1 Tax=Novipirellula caenicola TaxID=1536901 RepID=A0ABP9VL66_9BACT